MEELLELRQSFMDWDIERRKKVDMILDSLDVEGKYVDVREVEENLTQLVDENKTYKELEPSAKKMFIIHYKEHARTWTESTQDNARRRKARRKLKKYKKQGLLQKNR